MGIADLKDQSYDTRNQIFKLNGTANFISSIDINGHQEFDEDLLTILLDAYIKGLNENDITALKTVVGNSSSKEELKQLKQLLNELVKVKKSQALNNLMSDINSKINTLV